MSVRIILSVLGGILLGYYFSPEYILTNTDIIIDIGLCILLFFVGIDIGKNKEVLSRIKKMGFKILLIPLMIIIGSITGSMLAGLIIDLPINESGAVGAGLGWYTLSAMMLANYSSELSTLAFLTNVVREIIALITIPLIAKYIGDLESIAPAGATAMDTALPMISRSTNPKTAIISFITGVILSTSVPILVPIIINI
ncbi:lysine exporter LysO family protein [Clostridium sp. D2Q-11]|uniref:Lysine exporter LysO family protein n=1 Tax=Anaeromonas frigoriresistens TaxID=2683708 RepID=A0A942V087_9FIRM|nr:lysine exporter LysO family protein [Anaeromonas frigoriresistens]MBS4540034.1 lysine exporter LysO family protein [Anaeromonas frigoriresistens]